MSYLELKAISKLVFSMIFLIGFIIICAIMLLDNILAQSMTWVVVSIAFIWISGSKRYQKELYTMIPFLLILLVVYALFGIVGFDPANLIPPDTSPTKFWISFAFTRILLFISTIYFIQIILHFIRLKDIQDLPISIHKKKYFILGKTLYDNLMMNTVNLRLYIDSMPEYQAQQLNIKKRIRKQLSLLLTIIFFVMDEARIQGELIDNRIRHCFQKEKR